MRGPIGRAEFSRPNSAVRRTNLSAQNRGRAGLPAPSVVRPAKIACIEPARIDRRIGRLDKAAARAVAQKLRGFLG
jgi:mRNA interferase MazF